MPDEGEIISLVDRIVRLWPILVLLITGIVGYINMQMIVKEIKANQDKWQENSEVRREKLHTELDSLDRRILILEIKGESNGKH